MAAEEWIIRVDGKEYGPADLTTLREWKAEGRVLATNEARQTDATTWNKAAQIPGLFEEVRPPVQTNHQRVVASSTAAPQFPTAVSTKAIIPETFRIYVRGFFPYLGLTLLILGPSICAQLTGAFVDSTPGPDANTRTLIAGGFALCMWVLGLVMTPIYIAGIQILTAAFAAGERISFFATLNEAVKFWPRVAFLWIFVILCYALTIVPLVASLTIMFGGVSILSIFLVLVVTSVVVWVIGWLWVKFMFWQQFAVLEGCNVLEALRRSGQLARSRIDLPWFRRPPWRGVFIASLWFALVLALYWPLVSQLFRIMFNSAIWSISDPQKLTEAVMNEMKNSGAAGSIFAAGVLQAILKPLLGIAFVLLFLDSNLANQESTTKSATKN
jgi:hypothetical protein